MVAAAVSEFSPTIVESRISNASIIQLIEEQLVLEPLPANICTSSWFWSASVAPEGTGEKIKSLMLIIPLVTLPTGIPILLRLLDDQFPDRTLPLLLSLTLVNEMSPVA